MSLTNTQYNAIMRQYESQQIANQHILEQRTAEIYQKLPRLKELDDAISTCSLNRAKLLINGDENALYTLKRELKALIAKKSRLLQQNGYPDDYLKLPYQCKACQDTGYIDNKKCYCFMQASINLVYTQSNIRNILEKENFTTFSYDFYTSEDRNAAGISSLDAAMEAVSNCHTFVEQFDNTFSNLFFYGDTGVGKTFLSHCVAKELLDSCHSVIYVTAFELFHIFEKNVFGRLKDNTAEYQNLFACDLLIIDDLGTELTNSFTSSQLFLCLNERIIRQQSTIISTNLNIKQLVDTYSERTFSRISSYFTMINLFGTDIRILKKLLNET
jgi:DNA replication protein DnaC